MLKLVGFDPQYIPALARHKICHSANYQESTNSIKAKS